MTFPLYARLSRGQVRSAVVQVSPAAPARWLSMGWQDFRHAPAVGLAYGMMVALMGWLVLALGSHPYFLAAAVSGFLLVGPVLGAGLLESSRALEQRVRPTFDSSLRAFVQNRAALVRLSLILFTISAAWLVLSTSVLVAAMGPIAPGVESALKKTRMFSTPRTGEGFILQGHKEIFALFQPPLATSALA